MTPDATQGRAIPFVVGKAMFQLLFGARLVWILPYTQSYVIGLSIVEEVNASAREIVNITNCFPQFQ